MSNDLHEHYDHYNPEMIHRLDGFYGRVSNRMSNHRAEEDPPSRSTLIQKLDFLEKHNEKHGYPGRQVTRVLKLGKFSGQDKLKCFFMTNQFNPKLPSKIEISLVSEENRHVILNAEQEKDGGYVGDLKFDSNKEQYYLVEIKYSNSLTNAQIKSCSVLFQR